MKPKPRINRCSAGSTTKCRRCGAEGPTGVLSRLCDRCANADLESLEEQFNLRPGELGRNKYQRRPS